MLKTSTNGFASDVIDGERLLHRLRELAHIGATGDGGVTRLAYSDDDIRARSLVAEWLAEAGVKSRVDPAGNLIAHVVGRGDSRGALATGSHLDTVVRGGRFDGAYGVVASLEAMVHIVESKTPLWHDLVLVVFSNEEGANGTPGMVGSQVLCGFPVDVDQVDRAGVPLWKRIEDVGGDATALSEAVWAEDSIAAFVEAHIEQGPVLETERADIGVVTSITGRSNLDIRITGEQQHAGTTPMTDRCDALVIAARVIGEVSTLAREGVVRVATTGHITCSPNVWNVIPGLVNLTVDLRDEDDNRIAEATSRIHCLANELSTTTGASIDVRQGPQVPAVPMDHQLADCVSIAADQLALPSLHMPSGAGHDAQLIARIAPTTMIFVPSIGGVSHTPQEDSHDHHLVAGANVLLRSLRLMDQRVGGGDS
ncbi:Zn-dependent hydrolase [Streptomyces shenzhenensis]|uniref:Zn-dependent hydrolase n=1 Tax=Streptomyces shenzhenensis TaxID=943815 RepID=UPI001F21C129|nr:Zn-dependent hydrolase [Streptomyces shenzhenensis]